MVWSCSWGQCSVALRGDSPQLLDSTGSSSSWHGCHPLQQLQNCVASAEGTDGCMSPAPETPTPCLALGHRDGGGRQEEGAVAGVSLTWTCRTRICVGRHCTLRLLQHPEQRCTSTQGGHTTKLALVLSTMLRETSKTTSRVLHSARTAVSAAARASTEGQERSRACNGLCSCHQPTTATSAASEGPHVALTRTSICTHVCSFSFSHPSRSLPI